jgi:hypothetical protein
MESSRLVKKIEMESRNEALALAAIAVSLELSGLPTAI